MLGTKLQRRGVKMDGDKLAEVAWSGGKVRLGDLADSAPPDVVLHTFGGKGDGEPVAAVLVGSLEPLVQRFFNLAGDTTEVQSFRYQGTDGVPRRFLWCAACGDTMIADLWELQQLAVLRCRKCSAAHTVERCRAWHAFGKCGACNPGVG